MIDNIFRIWKKVWVIAKVTITSLALSKSAIIAIPTVTLRIPKENFLELLSPAELLFKRSE